MRPLEITLVLLLIASALSSLFKRSRLTLLLSVLAILTLALHAAIEGVHWQMYSAYLAVMIVAAIGLSRTNRLRSVGVTFILLLTLGACGCSVVMPMFRLPAPTGNYPIGTRLLYLVDRSRPEVTGDSRVSNRQLMIQVWYPAVSSRLPLAPYRRSNESTFKSSYQSVLPTHSRLNAPVALSQGLFSVILFNPAWTGRRTQNTYLTEDLASHGFVVVGIDHPGNSGPTSYPDGHVNQPAAEDLGFDSLPLEGVDKIAVRALADQVADNRFVLNELERLNGDPTSPFYRKLDTTNVGALGHSFGGAVAAQTCLEDPRVKSALDLDGSFFGDVGRRGLQKPFMLIEEELETYSNHGTMSNADRINEALDARDQRAIKMHGGYHITLRGSTHSSFTDRSLFSPFKSLSGEGSLPKTLEYSLLKLYALGFFQKTLLGGDPSILTSKPPVPEVSVDLIPPSQN